MFTLTGKGTAVVGEVQFRKLKLGDRVDILLDDGKRVPSIFVSGIEMYLKQLDYAEKGDSVGVLLRGVNKSEIRTAQVLVNPDADVIHEGFVARIHHTTKSEGGNGAPLFSYYKPKVAFIYTYGRGRLTFDRLYEGKDTDGDRCMLMLGQDATVFIKMDSPIALVPGIEFAMNEGKNNVATGVVTEVF